MQLCLGIHAGDVCVILLCAEIVLLQLLRVILKLGIVIIRRGFICSQVIQILG